MNLKILFQKLNLWIEHLVGYPGCDQKTLILNKNLWITCVVGLIYTSLLVLTTYLINPGYKILISYGLVLISVMLSFLVAGFFFKRSTKLLAFINQSLFILVTFIFILKLGGIPFSGGLVFVSLTSVFFIIAFQKISYIIVMFSFYVLSVIVAGMLQPYLTAFPELNLNFNVTLFVINILMMSGMILVFIINVISQNVKIEQLETIRIKELDEAKTKLFTNITHEFRTPLTVIQGMTNLIKTNPEEWIELGTGKIENQIRNLLALVNQMLDLSKLEAGAMPVHRIQSDIINYLKYLSDSFVLLAQRKSIQLNFISEDRHFIMDFDQEKIMYIVSNLLSNALKYTPSYGTIELYAGQLKEQNEFVIKVSDNGQGIPSEHLPFIFDRFFRVEEDLGTHEGGSGLGLALVKELVKLLGGSIQVSSSMESGTTFIAVLPVTNNAPEKEIIPNEGESPADLVYTSFLEDDEPIITENEMINGDLPILLVVEDSHDLKLYLKALLGKQYRLVFASNGKAGLQKALDHIPDIVVSDVMMPVMDGISMLDVLKHDIRTSHIPVILLTAKADIDSRLIGLDKGADDYLAKPFNENELLIRIRTLIELRQVLHQRYASGEQVISPMNQTENFEDSFIHQIRSVMEENLYDDHFDVHQLCLTLGMSRSQLYRKFKSLTNLSVIDYFWTLRLHKAKKLFQTTAMNVSEVAFAVGFKNLSHFSRAFKEKFGMNPSEVRK